MERAKAVKRYAITTILCITVSQVVEMDLNGGQNGVIAIRSISFYCCQIILFLSPGADIKHNI
jgi:hypothetical protein